MTLDAIVLDLDDTLYDTAGHLVPLLEGRAFDLMRDAGVEASADELVADLREIKRVGEHSALRRLAEAHGLDRARAEEIQHAFHYYDVPPLSLDPRVATALDELGDIAPLAVLTAGNVKTQSQKVDHLGIRDRFVECVIVLWDEPRGKTPQLRDLCERRDWQPDRVVVAGDRQSSDVRAANEVGCLSVHIDSPDTEYAHHKSNDPRDVPWRTIAHISELPALIRETSQ